jgi:GNAT superfamily N-acetyltransferase
MSAYRFCRTDDIGLLVDALNRCWAPYFPGEPAVTPAVFKRSIRDLQVWCSSCMVAFAGTDPIGVLIGAKRPGGTLIHRIAVHPEHRRQGHGRHMLDSLGSKLAILGPPRIVAEVPETNVETAALFRGGGYVQEALLIDYVGQPEEPPSPRAEFVIPVTVDDLAANGLLGKDYPQTCWERSVETLTARKDHIAGLAVASDEQIEAYILYIERGVDPPTFAPSGQRELRGDHAGALAGAGTEIMALRSFVEDGGARLTQLLSRLGAGPFRLSKVHPEEISTGLLETLGFRAADTHRVYAATARTG